MKYKVITGALTIIATLTTGLVFAEGLADRRGEVWHSTNASKMVHDIHQQHGATAAGMTQNMPSKMGMETDYVPANNSTLDSQQKSEKNQHPKTELLKKKSAGGSNY